MRPRYGKFNSKRRIAAEGTLSSGELEELACQVSYSGNPEHKRNPGDFGLEPPASPRRDKSLCDVVKIFKRADALLYLKEGLRRGAIDTRDSSSEGWPKIVWAVTEDDFVLEAQRDSEGSYHGYPLPTEDPMSAVVLKFWNAT